MTTGEQPSRLLAQLQQWIQLRRSVVGERLYVEPTASRPFPSPMAGSQGTSEQELPLPSPQRPRFHMPAIGGEDLFAMGPPWLQSQSLSELYALIHTCTACSLGLQRTNFVFGSGNPRAEIVVIGEAPGAEEDARGEPFVGAAGQLLTRMLQAIQLRREDVYICNVLKCRPPNNRRPTPQEISTCRPYLWKQLELIQPAFLLVLGATAATALLEKEYKIAELRGRPIPFHGMVMVVTYHPAALLRNPQWKSLAWQDLQLLRRLYDAYVDRASCHPCTHGSSGGLRDCL